MATVEEPEPERIVVAAVGLHMPDRLIDGVQAVQAIMGKVDRVVLFTRDKEDRAAPTIPGLRERLAETCMVKVLPCDIFDQASCFRVLDELYTREILAGNQLVLLMGTGSQLFAGVGYATASRHSQPMYYIEWLDPGVAGPPRVLPVDPFPPQAPEEDVLVALNYISSRKSRGPTGNELLKFLKQHGRPVDANEGASSANAPGVRRRRFAESLLKRGFAYACPPDGVAADVPFEEMIIALQSHGQRMQVVYGYRCPPTMWRRALEEEPSERH